MLGEREDEMEETRVMKVCCRSYIYMCVGLGMELLYFAGLETNHSIYIAPSPN